MPIPVVSMSNCRSRDIRTIRVPQFYLNRTRRLVIDFDVALHTDLSWFVTSMPHLLEIEMYVRIDYSRVTDITKFFTGLPDDLDLRDLDWRECSYEVENVPEGTQANLRDVELLPELEIVQDQWTGVIDKWSTEPRIFVRRPGVYYSVDSVSGFWVEIRYS